MVPVLALPSEGQCGFLHIKVYACRPQAGLGASVTRSVHNNSNGLVPQPWPRGG